MEYYNDKFANHQNIVFIRNIQYDIMHTEMQKLIDNKPDLKDISSVLWHITESAIEEGINELHKIYECYFDEFYYDEEDPGQQIYDKINEDMIKREIQETDAHGMRVDKYEEIAENAGMNAKEAVKYQLYMMDSNLIDEIGIVMNNLVKAKVILEAANLEMNWAFGDALGWKAGEIRLKKDKNSHIKHIRMASKSNAIDTDDYIWNRDKALENMEIDYEYQTLASEQRAARRAQRMATRKAERKAKAKAAWLRQIRRLPRPLMDKVLAAEKKRREAKEKTMDEYITAIYDAHMIDSNSYNGGKKNLYKTRKAKKIKKTLKKKYYKKNKKHKYKKRKQTIKKI